MEKNQQNTFFLRNEAEKELRANGFHFDFLMLAYDRPNFFYYSSEEDGFVHFKLYTRFTNKSRVTRLIVLKDGTKYYLR